jgi:hypothetical protein
MAAPPPLPAKTASHRNQMPSSRSLAGGSAYNNRPLVLKGQNVLNFLLPGADVRLSDLPGLSSAELAHGVVFGHAVP